MQINLFTGFKLSTWNFSEAGHGKGAPDGVGATIKRMADHAVLAGEDITSASELVSKLKDKTKIALFLVPDTSLYKLPALSQLKAVPGTMTLHQVVVVKPKQLYYRDVSCLCATRSVENCSCYNTKFFSFAASQNEE